MVCFGFISATKKYINLAKHQWDNGRLPNLKYVIKAFFSLYFWSDFALAIKMITNVVITKMFSWPVQFWDHAN